MYGRHVLSKHKKNKKSQKIPLAPLSYGYILRFFYLFLSKCWTWNAHFPRHPGREMGVAGLSAGRWGRSKAWSGRRSVLETISVFKSLTGLSFGGCLELQKKYKLYYFFWSWWPLYITLQNISSGVCVQASSIWEHVLYSYILITIYIIFQM